MTAQAARARGASRAAPRAVPQPRPSLTVVRGLHQVRSNLPFLGLVVLLLVGALTFALVLNAMMAHTAGELQRARESASEVREASVVLQSQLYQRSSSAELAARAQKLGMVPAGAPGVVDLKAGSVTAGKPAAAPAPAAPPAAVPQPAAAQPAAPPDAAAQPPAEQAPAPAPAADTAAQQAADPTKQLP